jgi:hypothetical protein
MRSFHNPSPSIPPQLTPILVGRGGIVTAGGNDRIDSPLDQQGAHRVAVVAAVGNQSLRLFAAHCADVVQRRFEELDFRRGSLLHVNSERSPRAIGQYHKLRSLAALGRPDQGPPFLAVTNVPSTKHSSQCTFWRSSSWSNTARHRFSNTPLWAHWHSRRCTVLGLPCRAGNSLHGAPVHRIHKMPSKHFRSSAGGRPPLGRAARGGNTSWTACHCRSDNDLHATISSLWHPSYPTSTLYARFWDEF